LCCDWRGENENKEKTMSAIEFDKRTHEVQCSAKIEEVRRKRR